MKTAVQLTLTLLTAISAMARYRRVGNAITAYPGVVALAC
jgi:hypothetical protein